MIKNKRRLAVGSVLLWFFFSTVVVFSENNGMDTPFVLEKEYSGVFDETTAQILFDKWDEGNKDAEVDLARVYLHILEYSPEVFIVVIEKNQDLIDSWLKVVMDKVFVYRGQCGKVKYLECRQTMLKSTLQTVRSRFNSDRYKLIVDRIYTKIHNLKPRKAK